MKKLNNKIIISQGLTLIEILVAVAIFLILIGTIFNLFISAIRIQRRILANQELLDQTSYVLEYMGRALRMAKRDSGGNCLRGIGVDYILLYDDDVPPKFSAIRFLNSQGFCQQFQLSALENGSKKIQEMKSTDATELNLLLGAAVDLTPSFLSIDDFNILKGGNLQPLLTIFLKISSKRVTESPPTIRIQTSVSKRDLN